jgi:hypothetical protein
MPVPSGVWQTIEQAREDYPEAIADILACHLDDMFAAARSGVHVACEVRTAGQNEPYTGMLVYAGGSVLAAQLTQYVLSPNDAPFTGHFEAKGAIEILGGGSFVVTLGPGTGIHEVSNVSCIGDTIYGKADDGTAYWVHLRQIRF